MSAAFELEDYATRVRAATEAKTPLRIRGGGSKDFYGGPLNGEILDMRLCAGIVAYEPTELVITARCGTPLAEIEAALAERGQRLAFEPPHFTLPSPPRGGAGGREEATLGGCVAAGLSGPGRASAGSVRDFVLGVKLLNGRGEVLNFGGQVMKNVAGYDVSRLLAGSLGTLGVMLEISLKVLPRPVAEVTLRLEGPQSKAIELMNRLAGRPLPISATCWCDDLLTLRLSGARAAVAAACQQLGGELVEATAAAKFWRDLREQQSAFFAGEQPLWRLSLPSVTPALALPGVQLLEWGGSLRWLKSGADPAGIRDATGKAGGHATLFRASPELKLNAGVFQPLQPALLALHRRLKQSFDPQGIFNPGRMYSEF
ncbi:MAG: glycolate oxidase subunit GlcE [Sterolibacterium sp.]|jgi:glycolate oxidase FAD binding subunit